MNPVKKLIFGTAQLGMNYGINNQVGKLNPQDAFKLLKRVAEERLGGLESSESYGDAHLKIEAAASLGVSIDVYTKFSLKEQESLHEAVERIYAQLKDAKIVALSFHKFSDYVSISSQVGSEMKIALSRHSFKLGVSLYTLEEAMSCVQDSSIKIIQIPFNLLDCDAEKRGVLKALKQSGKTVHVRSIFLQGLFHMDPLILESRLPALKAPLVELRNLSKENKIELHELALCFPFFCPEIDGVIVGMDQEIQLIQNLNFLKKMQNFDFEKIWKRLQSLRPFDRKWLNPSEWQGSSIF